MICSCFLGLLYQADVWTTPQEEQNEENGQNEGKEILSLIIFWCLVLESSSI